MLRNKPRQLPSRADQPHPLRPHHTSFTPAEHQPRQTSFGKLVALASRDRAVGQKYQATNDDTVKMNRLFGEWEPEEEKKVEVEHHTVPMGPGYGRRPLQIDTTTSKSSLLIRFHYLCILSRHPSDPLISLMNSPNTQLHPPTSPFP